MAFAEISVNGRSAPPESTAVAANCATEEEEEEEEEAPPPTPLCIHAPPFFPAAAIFSLRNAVSPSPTPL